MLIEALAGEIKLVIFALVGVIFIVGWTITACVRRISGERSRRELFAYVAEGSITPEQARDLLDAEGRETLQKGLLDAVTVGVIKPSDLESMFRPKEKSASPAESSWN